MSKKITFKAQRLNLETGEAIQTLPGELFEANGYQFGIEGNMEDGYHAIELSTGLSAAYSNRGCDRAPKQSVINSARDISLGNRIYEAVHLAIARMESDGIPYPLNPKFETKNLTAERHKTKNENNSRSI